MDTVKSVIWCSDPIPLGEEAVKKIGGKALGLHSLKQMGIRVPLWATVTSGLFKSICEADTELSAILASKNESPLKKAAFIRDRIRNINIGNKSEELLFGVWRKISEDGRYPLAIRSSSVDEDSEKLSFAGQMDSLLNIRTKEELLSGVRRCWASLFGDRAVLYRMQNGINPWEGGIAVIIQQMVRPDVSGVIFTANPLSGNREEMLVSSVWGLGEGLVSGVLDADTFLLDSKANVIKSDIAEKEQRIVYAKDSGTVRVEVEASKREAPTLGRNQLKELHRIALKVQDFKGKPMDIEFAIAGRRIYLLQARPITHLKECKGPGNNFNVWDNSNIVESYSGVTTPLTFSFIRRAYSAVYWQFCETIGVDKKTILKNRHVLENMLGLIEGRVYYNLLNWYRLISLMPGFKYNKNFMEQMMGLQVIKNYNLSDESENKFRRYFVHFPNLVRVGFKMLLAHISLAKKISEFHTNFERAYSHYSKLDYQGMTPPQIVKVYQALEDEILWKWKAPILNDFETMIFYGILKKLTVKWGVDKQGSLQNDLLCGEGGIKSTEVTTQLIYLAREIEKNGELKRKFLEASAEGALSLLRKEAEFSEINKEFNRYLDEYGVRSIEEMKLESVPIKDNPIFCISVIQNYLRNTVPDPSKQAERERTVRINAEDALKEQLKNKMIFLLVPKLSVYKWVLQNTRTGIRNRENQRFARTQAYSLIRNLMRSIGNAWQEKGIVEQRDDIFYLEMDEIWAFIEGTSTTVDLKDLISLRKKEFDQYRKENPPDHIETSGEAYDKINYVDTDVEIAQGDLLRGTACCAGIVEREVRVVFKPDSDLHLNGEIMVAKQTDPGWVILFPSVSGLIIEKGSMLSHSAIVAREMGIPAVVGVKNATKILKTGEKVILNGAEGTIKILKGQRGAVIT